MGFDNECILNIQSLAGEYFCPVCRLLVYPNEALQAQCTHLYCKPCLTYIVSTTQACPYDGYLVTEADSKPLIESNKPLAETIGKITVHCLYHRSGCTWQGPLSDCTSHCSGCAFGNSPVVCNRCGIQIVHRQVQEHAQNCPGVQQPQSQQVESVQDAAATGTPATSDQTQATTKAGATTSQVQTQTLATPPPGKDSSQQANSNSQAHTPVQAAVPTTEQWYQQQQQYQQYYQQYPGYNPYHQQYYPYQQQAVPQYQQQHFQAQSQGYVQQQQQSQPQPQMQPQPQVQPQAQPQPQVQPQAQPQLQLQPSQPPVQAPVAAQPQNQSQVNPQQQTHPLPHSHPLPQPQSYPQAHAQSYPQVQPHPQPHPVQPHPQHMQMPQYQQPVSQMQHTQTQIQYPVPQPQPQPQSHPQTQQQTQVQHQSQPQSQNHPQLHPPLPNQTQAQNTPAHSVTGYHSYPQPQPQPQPHQQMPFSGPTQHQMPVNPHGGAHLQMQMRPPQSHAIVPNQQHPSLVPSPVQRPNVPPVQQPPVHPHAPQHGVLGHQRPVMQPVQQPMPQQYVQQQQQQPFAGKPQHGSFAPQQPPVQSHLRPQGPPHSFQQHSHGYSQQQQQQQHSIAPLHGMQSHQPQNIVGQPMTSNYAVQSQPYQQPATVLPGRPVQFGLNQPSSNQNNMLGTNNQMQLSSEQQSVAASKPSTLEKQDIAEKSVDDKEAESSSQKTATNDASKLDATSGPPDAVGMKISKSETDVRSMADEIQAQVEDKTNPVDTSAKEFVTDPASHATENADPVIKQMVKEEAVENDEDHKDSANLDRKQVGNSVLEDKDMQDGPPLKTSPLQEAAQLGELQKGKNLPQAQGIPQGPGFVPPSGKVQPGGFVQSPPTSYGSSSLQQRPTAPSMFQAPPPGPAHLTQVPGNPPTQFGSQGSGHVLHPGQSLIPPENFQLPMVKPHASEIPPVGIPGSASAASFGRGPGHHGPPQHSFEPPAAPQGPYNQGHFPPSRRISQGDPVGGLTMRSLPPSGFDLRGEMMAGGPPYGAEGQTGKRPPVNPMEVEIFPSQRPGYLEGRRPDSHLPGSLERSPLGQPSGIQSNMMRINGAPGLGLQDERFKPFSDERINQFQMDPAHRVIDREDFEEDLKQFPRPSYLDTEPVIKHGSRFPSSRPLDRGSHGFGMDVGPGPFDKGLNYNPGLKLDPVAGSAPSRYLPSYGVERPVGLHEDAAVRSDFGRTHPDFLGPGPGYGRRLMDGSSPRSPVREYPGMSSRGFGGLPGNLASSRLGLDDIDGREFRRFGDPIGNTFHESRFPVFPSHLRRVEFEGPGRSGDLIGQDFLPSHLRRGETIGFGGFPGHPRMGDLGGPGTFPHPRLGEPGFRSRFPHQGFPNDGGIYAGDMEPFENSRKRKPPSMGWCRICKVDCETVDGLDLHSQTREHQKMAMDMVVTIKQNAKKQKLTSGDRATHDDANKTRNANSEARGKKH